MSRCSFVFGNRGSVATSSSSHAQDNTALRCSRHLLAVRLTVHIFPSARPSETEGARIPWIMQSLQRGSVRQFLPCNLTGAALPAFGELQPFAPKRLDRGPGRTRALKSGKENSNRLLDLLVRIQFHMLALQAAVSPGSSRSSETTASVVSSSEAIDAAFCSAERTTFVGSMTPAATRSS